MVLAAREFAKRVMLLVAEEMQFETCSYVDSSQGVEAEIITACSSLFADETVSLVQFILLMVVVTEPPVSLVVKENQTELFNSKQKLPDCSSPSSQPGQMEDVANILSEKTDSLAHKLIALIQLSFTGCKKLEVVKAREKKVQKKSFNLCFGLLFVG